MVSFSHKKISDENSLPLLLKEAREESRLTLEKLEKQSRVQKKYLVALEEGHYWDLPGQVYGRQFIRAYLRSLTVSVNEDVFLGKFDEEFSFFTKLHERGKKVKPVIENRPVPRVVVGPGILKKAAVLLVVLGFAAYLGWEIYHITQPPQLVVDSPADNLVTSRQVVEIKGWVEPESKLLINGQDVYSDRSGRFTELIGLQPGVNLISFSAKRKYSREKILTRKVMVKRENQVSQSN